MYIKFLDVSELPAIYSTPEWDLLSVREVSHKGKTYAFLGQAKETLTNYSRLCEGIKAFCKTLFLGYGIFSEEGRNNWKSFWSGKKVVKLYGSEFLATKILANQGNVRAQFNLGIIYEKGEGVAQSDEKAVEYFQLAANQGDVRAQFSLGIMYEKGKGIAQSDEKAVEYFQLAAKQGNASAQCCLGIMYLDGKGIDQSHKKAVKYFQLAADQGDMRVQFFLKLAADQGDQDAKGILGMMDLMAK